MQYNAYYPGDVVKIESNFVSAPTTIYSQDSWMMTAIGFTTDPTTDANWVKISGCGLTSETNQTPNT